MAFTSEPEGFNPLALTEEDLEASPALTVVPLTAAPSPTPAPAPAVVREASTPTTAAAAPAAGTPEQAAPQPTAQSEPTPERDEKAAAIDQARANRAAFGKKALTWVAIAVAAVAGWRIFAPQPAQAATPGGVGTSVQAAVAPPSTVVDADMAVARSYLTEHGKLEGIVLDGAQLAVRGTTMYAARVINGECTVYGILDGRDLAATTDTGGAACTGQIVTVQAQLDQAAQQQQFDAAQQARSTLELATTAAQYYASRNFVGGAQSFTGIPEQLQGAAVARNNGDWILLRVSLPAFCMERMLTAAGEAGEFNECAS